eukprot:2037283-Rhodomonas_salina.3
MQSTIRGTLPAGLRQGSARSCSHPWALRRSLAIPCVSTKPFLVLYSTSVRGHSEHLTPRQFEAVLFRVTELLRRFRSASKDLALRS